MVTVKELCNADPAGRKDILIGVSSPAASGYTGSRHNARRLVLFFLGIDTFKAGCCYRQGGCSVMMHRSVMLHASCSSQMFPFQRRQASSLSFLPFGICQVRGCNMLLTSLQGNQLHCRCLPNNAGEEDSRVLNVQHRLVWEVDIEGHCRGCCDHICPMLLLQTLMEHLHVQQSQKPVQRESEPAQTSAVDMCDNAPYLLFSFGMRQHC